MMLDEIVCIFSASVDSTIFHLEVTPYVSILQGTIFMAVELKTVLELGKKVRCKN